MKQPTKQKPTLKSTLQLVLKIYLGIFLLVFLVWMIFLGWHTIHLYRLAQDLKNDPSEVQMDTILPLVQQAAGDTGVIYGELRPLFPLFNFLQGIPGVGPYLGQVGPLLTYTNGLIQAGEEISLGLKPLLGDAPDGQGNLTLPERASQALESGQAHFITAAQEIDQADQVRDRILPELLPDSIRPLFMKLDGRFELLLAGVKFLQAGPLLVGTGEPQSYLVLAQNRDELRATGGFISGIGLVTIKDGKILQFSLGDSYQVDDFSKPYPKPPEPLKRFMLADYWVTRDSNWSPNFPTSAQEAQNLYSLSTGINTQGVIAFNQLTIRSLLKVIGPVEVPGTDGPVTAENVEDYMRQAWAPAPEEGLSEEWWLHRKDFMQLLGGVILEKVLDSGDQEQLLNLVRTIVDLLDQGQLLLYFNDPSAQLALAQGGWDGGLHPGRSDFLYLSDSNVGFNKVDSVIQRSLVYRVDLGDLSHPTGEVTLSYLHTGTGAVACKQEISYGSGTYQDMQQRCYLDYWRIYAPAGSGLLASSAKPVAADMLLNHQGWSGQVESLTGESGTQVFAGLLMVPQANVSEVILSYSLPGSVIRSMNGNIQEYALKVQVQPGLDGLSFKLELMLPSNTSLLNPGEGWQSLAANSWSWQGMLNRSTQFRLSVQVNP